MIANASYGKLEKQKQLKACGQKQGQGQSEECALFSRQTSRRTVFLGHIEPGNPDLQSKSVLANRKWLCLSFSCSIWTNETVKGNKIFMTMRWHLADFLEQQTEEKHKYFALKINCPVLLSFKFQAKNISYEATLAWKVYQSLRTALAQTDKQQHILQLFFFSLLNSLSLQIPWGFFPSFIHQLLKPGEMRGHVAFQVAFRSS